MSTMQSIAVMIGLIAAGGWGYFCGYAQGKAAEALARHKAETIRVSALSSG